MLKKYYLCIHGHFYQPPRENAWTNEIEIQDSAAPFHDWNERIFQECYKPNTEAVIVDEHDKVIKRVNNYEYFNFDFGPALLGWIKNKHPKTYSGIISADKKSCSLHNGHGNAIAMIYSHLIMPLADRKDKITQVKWGLEDFRFHFGRDSEGMWLPETACDFETLETLIENNVKYTILDPSQADSFRKIKKGKWKSASSENLNTSVPYRYFSKISKSKHIDIIFYNGPLSRNIAFDDHIYSSEKLLNRLRRVYVEPGDYIPLICSATDGETFGHHKKYTERTLSYLFSELMPESEFQVVNLGEYLEMHPPEHEVIIKKGPDNEGTSWSCSHGTGRWKSDCGCGRSEEHPSQQWRKPLRDSLNILRDRLRIIFEKAGDKYFADVYHARNDYIHLILNKDLDVENDFFHLQSKYDLDEKEKKFCIQLLEMQKYSMLMFTSCGWFFSDISGIETIQILEYAARAIEIANNISGIDLNDEFMENLSVAKSNNKKYLDCKDFYLKEVLSQKFLK
ncbi:MAG: hypothetical protein HGGPFJEG_00136 [Ignavibacteria bacterium]|nr:hypothetical protein [Ignavibacteria bacterium]